MTNGVMRRGIAVGLGALFLGASGLGGAGCGSSNSSSTHASGATGATAAPGAAGVAAPTTVAVADFSFTSKELHVKPGTVVVWTNHGQTTHNIQGPGFFSQALDPGKSYSHRFTKPGRYPYLCTLHPSLMKGTLIVS